MTKALPRDPRIPSEVSERMAVEIDGVAHAVRADIASIELVPGGPGRRVKQIWKVTLVNGKSFFTYEYLSQGEDFGLAFAEYKDTLYTLSTPHEKVAFLKALWLD